MKKILLMLAISALMLVSCGKKETSAESVAPAISVDSLLNNASALVGDTVDIEGLCTHLCKHGGRKAFLIGADSTQVLRCEATAEMGGAFSPDCVGQTLTVRGIVRENRIGENEVAQMEASRAAADSTAKAHGNCDTEKKEQGQDSIDSFEARMADYRARIAARNETEGKDYLSFYYIEALEYSKAE